MLTFKERVGAILFAFCYFTWGCFLVVTETLLGQERSQRLAARIGRWFGLPVEPGYDNDDWENMP